MLSQSSDAATAPQTNSCAPDEGLRGYDNVVLFFSGGKDSVACYLHLLELGLPASKIEIHHHLVDEPGEHFMDWPCTGAYIRAFGKAFGSPVYFSWRRGGFRAEMLRDNQPTGAVAFETPQGETLLRGGDSQKLGTRLRFPQVSASLTTRWCSAYLKCDVGARLISGQDRFNHSRTLVVTGERAEESAARANYAVFEPHRTDRRDGALSRLVDHWRPVHGWTSEQVWSTIERWKVQAHPAYHLGWGRASCAFCIFGGDRHWASAARVLPEQYRMIQIYEQQFGVTIHRKLTVGERVARGQVFDMDPFWVDVARRERFDLPIRMDKWVRPVGASSEEACGPT